MSDSIETAPFTGGSAICVSHLCRPSLPAGPMPGPVRPSVRHLSFEQPRQCAAEEPERCTAVPAREQPASGEKVPAVNHDLELARKHVAPAVEIVEGGHRQLLDLLAAVSKEDAAGEYEERRAAQVRSLAPELHAAAFEGH